MYCRVGYGKSIKIELNRILGIGWHARSIYLSFPVNILLSGQTADLFVTWLSGRKTSYGREELVCRAGVWRFKYYN